MNEEEEIAKIQQRLNSMDEKNHPSGGVNIKEDIAFLLNLLRQKNEALEKLKRKNDVLLQQNLELNQEIENVKGDFGDQSR